LSAPWYIPALGGTLGPDLARGISARLDVSFDFSVLDVGCVLVRERLRKRSRGIVVVGVLIGDCFNGYLLFALSN
jgi:hypothetical protein